MKHCAHGDFIGITFKADCIFDWRPSSFMMDELIPIPMSDISGFDGIENECFYMPFADIVIKNIAANGKIRSGNLT